MQQEPLPSSDDSAAQPLPYISLLRDRDIFCVNKPLLYRSRECEEEELVKVIARNVNTKQPLASQQRHKSGELHSWLLNVNIILILRRLVILIREVMACK